MNPELRVSLWATNLAAPAPSLDAWVARVEGHLAGAKQRGSELLVMPEYACAEWLSWAGELDPREEVEWLAARAQEIVPALHAMARSHGVGLLAGTMPWRAPDGEHTNRAVLFVPEGEADFAQDKLALTPWEHDPEAWTLAPGSALRIAEWRGMRIAIAICLDVEVPKLSARLTELDVDLLLVPSMTSSRAGYGRVFSCAKARAVELACPVAVVGAVGTLVLPRREETNVSGAAIFVPCEPGHDDGVIGAIGPFDGDGDGMAGPVLDAAAPIEACRRLRRGTAEVWPPRLSDAALRRT